MSRCGTRRRTLRGHFLRDEIRTGPRIRQQRDHQRGKYADQHYKALPPRRAPGTALVSGVGGLSIVFYVFFSSVALKAYHCHVGSWR
jgi:hypothetical protein